MLEKMSDPHNYNKQNSLIWIYTVLICFIYKRQIGDGDHGLIFEFQCLCSFLFSEIKFPELEEFLVKYQVKRFSYSHI